MILLIDNYDSFSYNLYQLIGEIEPDIRVIRNDEMTVEEAKKYVDEGQFAPGSMLPKVQAAMDFASSKEGRSAMITLLEKAKDGIQGRTGTKIHI